MQLHHPFWSIVLVCLCNAGAVSAQTQDTLTFRAGYTLQTDSNLYRLPSGANTLALLGRDSAAEHIGIGTLGVSLNKAYSLQRFELDLNLVDYAYQNFSNLSFTARNYTGAWRWSLTPRLRGNLTSSRQETLNSFADYQGYNQRNQRTDSATSFDTVYELSGPWRLLAGVSQQKQTNQQVLLADSDYSTNTAQIGARYEYTSGSHLTYAFKTANGSYLNRALSSTGLYDDGFDQTDSDLRLHWLISGKLSADANATYVNRTHPHFAQRDYNGLNTGITVNWSLSGKSALAAGWSQELSSYQTSYSNYSQTQRVSLGPVWQFSANALVRLRYEIAQRDFLGQPSALVSLQRADTTRDASVSFDWRPYQRLTLNAVLQNSQRSSSLTGLDYTADIATFSANYSF